MTMVVPVEALPVPITMDAHGIIKIGDTRVTLRTVVGAFNNGATPEEILQKYPTLQLGDVYAVVTYYLRERETVDKYIAEQREKSAKFRDEIEAHFPPDGIRERLLARKQVTP